MAKKTMAYVELENGASGLRTDDCISEILFGLDTLASGIESASIELIKPDRPDRPFGAKNMDPEYLDDLCIQWLRARNLIVED